MSYPGDFDTTMFPGTRYLAMARAFAIWSAVLFLLIAGLAGMLWWMMGSVRADPVLIQISDNGKTWTAMISSESDKLQYPAHRTFQEATIGNFAKMWFEISKNPARNEMLWCRSDREKCDDTLSGGHPCLVYCATTDSLFEEFTIVSGGDYAARANAGEEWFVIADSIRATPRGELSDRGGLWRLTATVQTGAGRRQGIEAFVRVARADEGHSETWGYYVADFKAYPGE